MNIPRYIRDFRRRLARRLEPRAPIKEASKVIKRVLREKEHLGVCLCFKLEEHWYDGEPHICVYLLIRNDFRVTRERINSLRWALRDSLDAEGMDDFIPMVWGYPVDGPDEEVYHIVNAREFCA